MRRTSIFASFAITMALLVLAATRGFPAGRSLPIVGGKPTLATINGEPLTLDEFKRAFAESHGAMTDNDARSRPNPSQLLDRLISVRLILQEARNIGLDELPEVRGAEKTFGEDTLRGMLYGNHQRNIKKPDRKEVERRYREAVKEVKVTSILFDEEEYAERLEAEVKAGGDFSELSQGMIAAGEAKERVEGQYLKFNSLRPEVAEPLSSMEKGDVSPPIRTGKQFSLLKLEDIRFPEDAAARAQAEKSALQAKKTASLVAYTESLRKKYAKIDRKLLESLDYESPGPGFEKFMEDDRTLAQVKGEKPVTVADLSKALEKKFFHGAERAAEKGKINPQREKVLDEILNRRVTLKEAKRQKLDRTATYKLYMEDYRRAILFGTFVQKVIVPEIRVDEEELKRYYQAHIAEYASPELVRIDSIVFSERKAAEEAIDKLRKGADFQWLRANAEGQVEAGEGNILTGFKGQLQETTTLPGGVSEAISGASAGDYRLYADPGKAYCVLEILERVPSGLRSFDSVQFMVESKVRTEKLQHVVREWEEKLRSASDVKIFATGEGLNRLVDPRGR